jgi:hypothetical protein
MTKSIARLVTEVVRSKSKGNFAVLKEVSGAQIKAVLVAVIVFGLADAVATKAILTLESSQDLFEVMR